MNKMGISVKRKPKKKQKKKSGAENTITEMKKRKITGGIHMQI